MKAIVLSGGLGTRLRPLSLTTPKALLPLVNRPLIEYQLDLLDKYQIREVIFCLNYQPQLFREYFEKFKIRNSKLKIDCVVEEFPLGTGGAVKNAVIKKKINEPVLIFNGDVLTEVNLGNFLEFHEKRKSAVTILLTPVEDPTLYGLVETNDLGRIKNFLEKPSLPIPHPLSLVPHYTINAGIYVFEPEVLDYIPSGIKYSLERGLFPSLLGKKLPLYGYIHSGYWLDIGSVEKYLQANFDLMDKKVKGVRCKVEGVKCKVEKNKRKGKLAVGEKTTIPRSAQVFGNVCIGKNCFVGKNVILKDTVILDHTHIGEGTKIEDSVIGNNCRIEENVVLSPGTALGDGSVVKSYSKL